MVTMQVKIERVENGMQEDGSAEPYYKVSFWGGVFCHCFDFFILLPANKQASKMNLCLRAAWQASQQLPETRCSQKSPCRNDANPFFLICEPLKPNALFHVMQGIR